MLRLVIFGNPEKRHVGEAIEEFSDFAKDKAEIVASCGIDECTADILKDADKATSQKEIIDAWNELVTNKHKYALVELDFAREHLDELSNEIGCMTISEGTNYCEFK